MPAAGLVLCGVGIAQHLDGFKGFFASGVEDAVAAVAIHGLEGGGCRRGAAFRLGSSADGEIVDVGESDGGDFSGERARNLSAEG